MGLYIEPRTISKPDWLTKHVTKITETEAEAFTEFLDDPMLLCYVFNGFHAIAVIFSARERERFLGLGQWLTVPRTAVAEALGPNVMRALRTG